MHGTKQGKVKKCALFHCFLIYSCLFTENCNTKKKNPGTSPLSHRQVGAGAFVRDTQDISSFRHQGHGLWCLRISGSLGPGYLPCSHARLQSSVVCIWANCLISMLFSINYKSQLLLFLLFCEADVGISGADNKNTFRELEGITLTQRSKVTHLPALLWSFPSPRSRFSCYQVSQFYL